MIKAEGSVRIPLLFYDLPSAHKRFKQNEFLDNEKKSVVVTFMQSLIPWLGNGNSGSERCSFIRIGKRRNILRKKTDSFRSTT